MRLFGWEERNQRCLFQCCSALIKFQKYPQTKVVFDGQQLNIQSQITIHIHLRNMIFGSSPNSRRQKSANSPIISENFAVWTQIIFDLWFHIPYFNSSLTIVKTVHRKPLRTYSFKSLFKGRFSSFKLMTLLFFLLNRIKETYLNLSRHETMSFSIMMIQ